MLNAHCSFAHLLISLKSNERFAQIAQDKWATVSELLRSLKTNEQPWAIHSGYLEKWANQRFVQKIWLKKSKILIYYVLFKVFKKKFEKVSKLLIFAYFLFFGEWCEWIAHFAQIKWVMRANLSPKMSNHEQFAQVAQRKWAIMSESLRSLTKNEQMSVLLIFLSKSLIGKFLDKKRVTCLEIKSANSQPWNLGPNGKTFLPSKLFCKCELKKILAPCPC